MERDSVRCAYDDRHTMPKSRLESHYLVCEAKRRRQHLYAVCPYNRMHHVPKDMIEEHKTNCASRRDDSHPIDDEIRQVLSTQGKKPASRPKLIQEKAPREANDCYIPDPSAPRTQFNPLTEDPWA
mmetsp:Transcript_23916/g.42367  ORF Transcript_23916/g.42367 Transcript_23916/m.42367 type:complete len:126 (-) Transcript_23916:1260-1637(-)